VAPNGQFGDGDGYCLADEVRFKSRRGRQKVENDLRSTATTRAKNRATADLVGMGEVSAEEIAPGGGEEDEHARALAAGAPASDELARAAFAALAQLLGGCEPHPAATRFRSDADSCCSSRAEEQSGRRPALRGRLRGDAVRRR
jgi:hypothetical protein